MQWYFLWHRPLLSPSQLNLIASPDLKRTNHTCSESGMKYDYPMLLKQLKTQTHQEKQTLYMYRGEYLGLIHIMYTRK